MEPNGSAKGHTRPLDDTVVRVDLSSDLKITDLN